jgi:excisionase family DNA binding protein
MHETQPVSQLITRKQLAGVLGVAERTLSNWATDGRYELPYVKIGSKVMYRRSDVERWLEKRTIRTQGSLS